MKCIFALFLLTGLLDECLTLAEFVFKKFSKDRVPGRLLNNTTYLLLSCIFLFYTSEYSIGYLVQGIWAVGISCLPRC